MRLHDGTPFAPIQILTGDTREACSSRCDRLLDDGRPLQRKSRIERRFESSPESRGSPTSGVLLVLFVQAKRIKPFPLPGTSRFYKPRFSSPQWRLRTNKIKTIPKGASRFCKPRISPPKQRLHTNLIKSFWNFSFARKVLPHSGQHARRAFPPPLSP